MESRYGFNTTETRSRLMSKIRSKNTTPELIFRKKLWHLGYRYRISYTKIPGKPDIVFLKNKLAIFIDGEFWHGYKWEDKKPKIASNREYWVKKIEGNIQRDQRNRKELEDKGWSVISFWAHEIKVNSDECLKRVIHKL
jgi:DNA mismatch endonuclease, patch repair protein